MKITPLHPAGMSREAAEQIECSMRRMFDRVFRRVERKDGTFLIVDRRTGAVVGCGVHRPGREELDF